METASFATIDDTPRVTAVDIGVADRASRGGNALEEASTVEPISVSMDASGDDWDAYVTDHSLATADHLWGWRDLITSVFGHETAYLVARRGAHVVGVLPIVLFRSTLFGRFAVSLPFLNYGGVLADDDDAAGALVARATGIARTFRASHLELRQQARRFSDLPCREHKLALTLPLPNTTDELWTAIDRKVRNQVRKAQKERLEAASGRAELVGEFYAIFARNMRDLGTPVYPRRLFDEVLARFPDRACVHVVRCAGVTMAASLSIRFRDTVLVPWASSLREYRHLCPNMLLYWSMLEHAVTSGARTFDFGRSSRGAGTHQFKLQWGAREAPLHWEYVLLSRADAPDQGPSNPKFAFAIEAWKKLPLPIANRIGPLLARHLP